MWGNHDPETVRNLPRWESSQFGTEIHLDGHRIVLCHYAMRVWNKAHNGSLMLYGHSHDSLPGNSQSLDVGVDCWGMQPVALSAKFWLEWTRCQNTAARITISSQGRSKRSIKSHPGGQRASGASGSLWMRFAGGPLG